MPDRDRVYRSPEEGMMFYYEKDDDGDSSWWVIHITSINAEGLIGFDYAYESSTIEEAEGRWEVSHPHNWGAWHSLIREQSITEVRILKSFDLTNPDWEV